MESYKKYSYEYVNSFRNEEWIRAVGGMDFEDDTSMDTIRLRIQ